VRFRDNPGPLGSTGLNEMDDEPTVIEVASDLDGARKVLVGLCDHGFVSDFELEDGSSGTYVLIGVSSSALIVDKWDSDLHRPASDPCVIELSAVRRIVVP
jgi:hypothetical protein